VDVLVHNTGLAPFGLFVEKGDDGLRREED
jgi:hypothetical protein